MNYKDLLKQYEASSYIINMTSFDGIIKTGISLGLSKSTTILDLCCGYGEMLKIWSEVFGISGTGVDMCSEFIGTGKSRLADAGIEKVNLIEGDILKYTNTEKYDVVSCTEHFGSIGETLAILEKYVKPGGKLVFCHVFSKIPNPPKELIDFEGPLPTLDELYRIFRFNYRRPYQGQALFVLERL